jgi:CheY-like chemotaxis protein
MLVALTGWERDKDEQRAAEAGFDDHLVDPVSLDQLKEISIRR